MRAATFGIFPSTLIRSVVAIAFLSFSVLSVAQQRDASATSFLNQVLGANGGPSAIGAIGDFTAQGLINHFWSEQPEQGQLTVKSRGQSEFRIDSILPEGTWSFIVKSGSGELSLPNGTIDRIALQNTLNVGDLTLPIVPLDRALSDFSTSIIDLGTVQLQSGSARQIRIQRTISSDLQAGVLSKLTQRDYFFDPSSYLLLEVRDMLHPNHDALNGSTPHVLRFSQYQTVNGIAVPFSIIESIDGQQTWSMHLSSISFNSSLSDSDFTF